MGCRRLFWALCALRSRLWSLLQKRGGNVPNLSYTTSCISAPNLCFIWSFFCLFVCLEAKLCLLTPCSVASLLDHVVLVIKLTYIKHMHSPLNYLWPTTFCFVSLGWNSGSPKCKVSTLLLGLDITADSLAKLPL